jgi:hypothetical protein
MTDSKPDFEQVVTGKIRPPNIPPEWKGRPTAAGDGWCWYDPAQAGNSVRIYRGRPDAASPVEREPYVVVVHNGMRMDREGNPVPGSHEPED